jgi:predicted transcriptional regulator
MTPRTKAVLEQVASWPEQDQDELAEYAREIEARRTGVYVLSDEEWADLQEGIAQADRGEFVPDDVVAKADKRATRRVRSPNAKEFFHILMSEARKQLEK